MMTGSQTSSVKRSTTGILPIIRRLFADPTCITSLLSIAGNNDANARTCSNEDVGKGMPPAGEIRVKNVY
jgi:hypothetical protein